MSEICPDLSRKTSPFWKVNRRLGRRPLPGNRFVSFVRAYMRCPVPNGNKPKTRSSTFSLFPLCPGGFPLCHGLSLFPWDRKWHQSELCAKSNVNSKWIQSESNVKSSPPSPQSSYPTLAGFIGITGRIFLDTSSFFSVDTSGIGSLLSFWFINPK